MKTKRVRDFMAKHYTTVNPDQSLATAVRTLLEYHQSADHHRKHCPYSSGVCP